MTEIWMLGWYLQFNGQEFEQTLGDGEGQGSQMHCSPWGHKESHTAERLNNNTVKDFSKVGETEVDFPPPRNSFAFSLIQRMLAI